MSTYIASRESELLAQEVVELVTLGRVSLEAAKRKVSFPKHKHFNRTVGIKSLKVVSTYISRNEACVPVVPAQLSMTES
jgi:hypothetical protein